MKKERMNPQEESRKRVTLPYIGRVLRDAGMDVYNDGHSVYVPLGLGNRLNLELCGKCLSVMFEMPTDPDDTGDIFMAASRAMANSVFTKVYLDKDEYDEYSLMFSAVAMCEFRNEFEETFDKMFKDLVLSARIFTEIRNGIQKNEQVVSRMQPVNVIQKEDLPN